MSQPITTIELLEALKHRFADESGRPATDYRVGKILQVSDSTVPVWRSGRSFIGDEMAIKIAEILELDVQFVLASLQAERARRAQNVRVADAWSTIARRVAAVTIVGTTLLLPFTGGSGAAIAGEGSPEQCVLC